MKKPTAVASALKSIGKYVGASTPVTVVVLLLTIVCESVMLMDALYCVSLSKASAPTVTDADPDAPESVGVALDEPTVIEHELTEFDAYGAELPP